MNSCNSKTRPSVPSGPDASGYGSGHVADGQRVLRISGKKEHGYQRKMTRTGHRIRLHIGTYNCRSLRGEDRLRELEEECSKVKWDILGLSEVRRAGELMTKLHSGNYLYHCGADAHSIGGVGFLINRRLENRILAVTAHSQRVAELQIRLNERLNLRIIQVYAPTSAHPEEEAEEVYDTIRETLHRRKTHHTIVMGDFNGKIGAKQEGETKIGPHGIGTRNERGEMLAEFAEESGLYIMNTFYKKKPQRKWTWISPNGETRNEIDYILAAQRNSIQNVSVLNKFNTGSDHRLVRATLELDMERERRQWITRRRKTPTTVDQQKLREELRNKLTSRCKHPIKGMTKSHLP